MPLITGNTLDEFAYSLIGLAGADTADYEGSVRALFGDTLAPRILEHYPRGDATPRAALIRLLSDGMLICPDRRLARIAARAGAPVWRYLWTHTTARGPAHVYGPGHVTDMPFWLGTLPDSLRTPAQDTLSHAMMDYLLAFARTGDPNHPGATAWPRYDAARDTYLRLDDVVRADTGVRSVQCDFWDALSAADQRVPAFRMRSARLGTGETSGAGLPLPSASKRE